MRKLFQKKLITPITIGVVLPLSGVDKKKGQSYLNGLNHYLKASDLNPVFRFFSFDSEGKSIEALKIVKNIQSKSFVRAILGLMLESEILAISGFNSKIPIFIPNSGPTD